jgi:predicted ester cyclase
MTSKLEVVQEWLDAAADDYDAAYEYFADDFQWVQTDGVVMDRAAYLGMANLLRSALPDLEHVVGEVREEDGSVLLISHFEGTHENDLDLSAMGMGVFPASGKRIVFPEGSARLSVRGDKITRLEQVPGSRGIDDFFAALSA